MKYFIHKQNDDYFVNKNSHGLPIEMTEEEHQEYRKAWNVFNKMQTKLERIYDANK